MIDLSGYTQAALQEEMLKQVPDDIDKRQGSIIQTAIGPAAMVSGGTVYDACARSSRMPTRTQRWGRRWSTSARSGESRGRQPPAR